MSNKVLTKLNAEELRALCQPTKCVICQTTLHESTTGMRKVDDGSLCSDCYFADFGNEIDKYPVGIPRMHRAR